MGLGFRLLLKGFSLLFLGLCCLAPFDLGLLLLVFISPVFHLYASPEPPSRDTFSLLQPSWTNSTGQKRSVQTQQQTSVCRGALLIPFLFPSTSRPTRCLLKGGISFRLLSRASPGQQRAATAMESSKLRGIIDDHLLRAFLTASNNQLVVTLANGLIAMNNIRCNNCRQWL